MNILIANNLASIVGGVAFSETKTLPGAEYDWPARTEGELFLGILGAQVILACTFRIITLIEHHSTTRDLKLLSEFNHCFMFFVPHLLLSLMRRLL